MKIVWSDVALDHLLAIHRHIASDSPRYASLQIDRITSRVGQLETFPESGAMVPEYASPTVRQLVEGPYRILYRVGNGRVEVLAVIHGARDLADVDLELD